MVFILLGNRVHSLKFQLISLIFNKNWSFFLAMDLDTCELFHCLARDCNYRDEKLCDVLKADCIAQDYILLSKLRSSWRFLKFSEALHVYSNQNFYVRNHFSQKAKGEISN